MKEETPYWEKDSPKPYGKGRVPVTGPLLVDVFGSLLEHMESQIFYENVYAAVRDATGTTWEGIKDFVGRNVQKATGIKMLLFG